MRRLASRTHQRSGAPIADSGSMNGVSAMTGGWSTGCESRSSSNRPAGPDTNTARPCAPLALEPSASSACTRSRSARRAARSDPVSDPSSRAWRHARSTIERNSVARAGGVANSRGSRLTNSETTFPDGARMPARRRSRSVVMSLACMPAGYPAYPHVRRAAAASSRRAVFDPERRSSQGGWGAARPGTGRACCEGSFFQPAQSSASPRPPWRRPRPSSPPPNDSTTSASSCRAPAPTTSAPRPAAIRPWASTRAGRWAASGRPRSSSWTASGSASTASGSAPRPARSRAAGATRRCARRTPPA